MATKKTASQKSAKKTTQKKAAKPKAKANKEALVVFAFRLTQAERNKIHATAGPRNATRLIRQVAVAFGNENEAGFKAAVKEAREART